MSYCYTSKTTIRQPHRSISGALSYEIHAAREIRYGRGSLSPWPSRRPWSRSPVRALDSYAVVGLVEGPWLRTSVVPQANLALLAELPSQSDTRSNSCNTIRSPGTLPSPCNSLYHPLLRAEITDSTPLFRSTFINANSLLLFGELLQFLLGAFFDGLASRFGTFRVRGQQIECFLRVLFC